MAKKNKKFIYEAFGMSECSTISTNEHIGSEIHTIGRPQRRRKVVLLIKALTSQCQLVKLA